MPKKLIIAEKPSLMRTIMQALSVKGESFTAREKGEYFSSQHFIATSQFGHLMELKMPEEYPGQGFRRSAYYKRCRETEFEVGIEKGGSALFSEPGGRKGSRQYRLTELIFDKSTFSMEDAEDYWRDWDILYTDAAHVNKEYPRIEYFIGEEGELVEGGYVFGIYRNAGEYTEKKPFIQQYRDASRIDGR